MDIGGIFTPDVIRNLASRNAGSAELRFRLEVLSSANASAFSNAESSVRADLASKRALWKQWLDAASHLGLLAGRKGCELQRRLVGANDNNFRSAIAECMTAWVFSTDLGFKISPRPKGRNGAVLEFLVKTPFQEIHVEVKSPRNLDELTKPEGGVVDVPATTKALASGLQSAAKQFGKDATNILVLAFPEVGAPIPAVSWEPELSLIPAFYGEDMLVTYPDGITTRSFTPKGKLLRRDKGQPRFTRVSAIVCIDDVPPYPKLQTVVLHNPYCTNPIDPLAFHDWRQLVPDKGVMRWTTEQQVWRT